MAKKKEKSLTITELIGVLEGFCGQGLANATVSFVTPENLNNYYLKPKCKSDVSHTKERDVVELHLNYWG